LPSERHDVYRTVHRSTTSTGWQIPLYVALTRNDEDVNIERPELVDALRSRKPHLAETMV